MVPQKTLRPINFRTMLGGSCLQMPQLKTPLRLPCGYIEILHPLSKRNPEPEIPQ